MQKTIVPTKQGVIGRMADYLMLPVMYLLQGNFNEIPQRTHRWNNQHLNNHTIKHLHANMIEIIQGVPGEYRRWFVPIPLYHMPIIGGWKKFVVLQPKKDIGEWYVGWVAFDALGLSKIPINGSVRTGIGPRQAQFFGLTNDGCQIDIDVVCDGESGKAGEFAKIPLL